MTDVRMTSHVAAGRWLDERRRLRARERRGTCRRTSEIGPIEFSEVTTYIGRYLFTRLAHLCRGERMKAGLGDRRCAGAFITQFLS
jgi:hypothetical protein